MTASPLIGDYETQGSKEKLLRFYPDYALQTIIIEPLLEERNFLRKSVVTLARVLGEHGIGSTIPDLPACGESLIDASAVSLSDWRTAVADVAATIRRQSARLVHMVVFRGGALIDNEADAASWWRFAPASGAELLRPFRRAQRLRAGQQDEDIQGYPFSRSMISSLETAIAETPRGPTRTVEAKAGVIPLWRRAEPDSDPDLVQWLAVDIAEWMTSCEAS
jgi:hypothetical protein